MLCVCWWRTTLVAPGWLRNGTNWTYTRWIYVPHSYIYSKSTGKGKHATCVHTRGTLNVSIFTYIIIYNARI